MKFFLVFVFTVVISSSLPAQEICKVLRADISDSYVGDCKKGLAHGNGIAKGRSTYEGNFKKGFPDGQGTMTYENGGIYIGHWKKGLRSGTGKFTILVKGKDSVAKGIWKGDAYVGNAKDDGFKVLYKKGIQRYTIKKMGDEGNSVSIMVFDDGNRYDTPLDIKASSGSFLMIQGKSVYDNISLPFDCDINFDMPNLHNSWTHEVQFKFHIESPGQWVVELHHKNI